MEDVFYMLDPPTIVLLVTSLTNSTYSVAAAVASKKSLSPLGGFLPFPMSDPDAVLYAVLTLNVISAYNFYFPMILLCSPSSASKVFYPTQGRVHCHVWSRP